MTDIFDTYSNGLAGLNRWRANRQVVRRRLREMDPDTLDLVIEKAKKKGLKMLIQWAREIRATQYGPAGVP